MSSGTGFEQYWPIASHVTRSTLGPAFRTCVGLVSFVHIDLGFSALYESLFACHFVLLCVAHLACLGYIWSLLRALWDLFRAIWSLLSALGIGFVPSGIGWEPSGTTTCHLGRSSPGLAFRSTVKSLS